MTNATKTSDGQASAAGGGAFVRLGWIVAGPLAMLMSVMGIAAQPAWSFGWRDVVFWCAVAGSAVLRCVDVMLFAGQTANGRPATRAVLAPYLVGLCVIATVAWYAAHSVHF
jgi:hypothetical protein